MTIIRLDKLLKTSTGGTLDKIIQRAQNMEALTAEIRSALPPEAAENLMAANLRDDGELMLICASSAWASRIRFESARLLDVARNQGLTVHRCQVTVGHAAPGD
jgi:hypothetical protein